MTLFSRETRYLSGLLILLLALAGWSYSNLPTSDTIHYFNFADQVTLLGIPNFNDVMSNLAFLAAGLYGLWRYAFRRRDPYLLTVSAGAILTAAGSALFHWTADMSVLPWDRLPMTIIFAGVISALIHDRIGPAQGRAALAVLLPFGLFTILAPGYSLISLRPYFALQYGGFLFCLLLAILRPSGRLANANVLAALGLYTVAKLLEVGDTLIFDFTEHIVSGHTLKHLFAALAVYKLIVTIQED